VIKCRIILMLVILGLAAGLTLRMLAEEEERNGAK
jgi:hypothetical protein